MIKEKAVFDIPAKNDLITIMNNTGGHLVYVNSRTQEEWFMETYGDTLDITYGELITMKSTQPKILKEAWALILDNNAIAALGLSKLYENILNPDDIEKFFKLSENKMEMFLDKCPSGMHMVIVKKAKDMIAEGMFDSRKKIELIEDKLKVKFDELIEG